MNKRNELMNAIENEFDITFMRTSEEFNGDPDGIWISAENGDTNKDGLLLIDYYTRNPEHYLFGVHKDLTNLLDQHDYFAEFEDAGTLMDPWNQELQYRSPGTHNTSGYDLFSLGEDGTESADDIGNW